MDTEKISILLWILYFCVIIYVVLETEDYCRLRKKQRIKRNANKQIENEAVEEKPIEESNTYYCDNCGAIVDEFDTTCPHCGLDFVEEDEEESYEFDYDYNEKHIETVKEEKNQEKETKKEFVDIKFMNDNKVYTYLAPKNYKIKEGDYYLVYSNGKKQPIKVVSNKYLKNINQNYNYKKLDIVEKIDEKRANGTNRIIDGSAVDDYWNYKRVSNTNYNDFDSYDNYDIPWEIASDERIKKELRREEYMMGETGQHYIPEFYLSEYDDIFTTQPVDEDDRPEINYNDYMMDEVMDDEFRGFFDEAKSYD